MVEQRSQLAMRLRPANAAVWSIDVPNSLVTRKIRMRARAIFANPFNAIGAVQSCGEKYNGFVFTEIVI
jgi:hypothetical protein